MQDSIPGITPKAMAKELKDLEQHKLIQRIVTNDYPVKITYRWTPYANTLIPIIDALKEWEIKHRQEVLKK
ncbi:winged helix-turn-helix transcriptional regulator [Sphingobacterium olei]|uniref:winged helix-turn-helix transcriptional regulator n=1 Tax=Sphingobacterium olei TaxID=2571155 RepID=UPI0021D39CD9|nr:helix-turn-helix domain-containing protein [Sphingobacterium olei]